MDHAKRGADALAAQDSLTAVTAYTQALLHSPLSPDYWTQRSTAFTRLKPPHYDLALQDAEYAVLCARKRGSREKILAAQQRRAIALFSLKQYNDASFIFDIVKKLTPEEKSGTGQLYDKSGKAHAQVDMWRMKVSNKLKAMSEEELAEVPETTVKEVPESELLGEKEMKTKLREQLKSDGTYRFEGDEDVQPKTKAAPASNGHKATEPPPTTASTTQSLTPADPSAGPPKIRHEWYQNATTVTITIYAKGVPKDKAEIDIQEDSLSVSFPQPSDPTTTYDFSLDPLYAFIDKDASSFAVMSTKVEIRLQKISGQKWAALEGTAPLKDQSSNTSTVIQPPVVTEKSPTKATDAAPSYPTSSRKGPKNWDKLAKDLTTKPKKENKDKKKEKAGSSSETEEVEDEYDSDLEGGDPADGFFKKLFKNSDPDTQRAMQKSFLESNGTTLSTNWSEVGAARVKPYESRKDD